MLESFVLSAGGKFSPPLSRGAPHTSCPPWVPVRELEIAYDSSSSLIAYLPSSCGVLASANTTGVPNGSSIAERGGVNTAEPPGPPPRSLWNQIWSSLCDRVGSRSVLLVASGSRWWRG